MVGLNSHIGKSLLSALAIITTGHLLLPPLGPIHLEWPVNEAKAEQVHDAGLAEKVDTILSSNQLQGAISGVSVRHAETGELIYTHHGDIRLHPASNMKLLTAAAALETLGEEYRFSTEVLTDGVQNGSELDGNLYLKGKGDPTLLKPDLEKMAENLKSQGIRMIKGNLIGDDDWYDHIRLSQDLNWSDEPYHTGAQVSALTLSPDEDFFAGTVLIEIMSGSGEKAEVRVIPETDYVTVINKTRMVPADSRKLISTERVHGTNQIIVEGDMPKGANVSRFYASVWEPTEFVVNEFKKALEENEIYFSKESEVSYGQAPDDAEVLFTKKSMPLSELLIPFLKLSNNTIGEVLTKEMGKAVSGEGSWEHGLPIIEDVSNELGIDPDTIIIRDGSGMSHKNYIPADALTELLYNAQDRDWFPVFKYALPVAGNEEKRIGGTLRHRMKELPDQGNVKAKTGTIFGVSTLAGYITSSSGEDLIFAILINNYTGEDEEIDAIEDELVNAIMTYE